MLPPIHTVLGASGSTGRAVIQELKHKKLSIRTVGRTSCIKGVTNIKANLLSEQEAIRAIQDSSFVYLCVGLPYHSKIWQSQWPKLMKNVLTACQKAKAKLIFFDNVYMYGPAPLSIPFTEEHPQHPVTKKGRARKKATDLLLQAIDKQVIEAVIGRSADFYGKFALNSPIYLSFLQNMLQGKAPQVLSPKNIPHTYAYSGDNGRALVALALDSSTYGQVWHLPVGPPITLEQVNEQFNSLLNTSFALKVVPKFMQKMLSIFIPIIGEVEEMNYQFNQPYIMSSKRFIDHFPNFQITSYEEGLEAMVQSFKKSS